MILGPKPLLATREACALHDELRSLLVILYDEKRALERVELSCKAAGISI